MKTLNVNRVDFVKSAAAPAQFIRSSLPAVAFAGKSNVGKSSVINRLLNRNNFARVGSEPGKTVHVNYFLVLFFRNIAQFTHLAQNSHLGRNFHQSEVVDSGLHGGGVGIVSVHDEVVRLCLRHL